MPLTEFKKELAPIYGPTAWEDKVWPQIKEVVKQIFTAMKGKVEVWDNYFHLEGWDLTIDDNLNVWVMEINNTPSTRAKIGEDTKITMLNNMNRDLVKVVVDYEEDPSADTGGWHKVV